MLKVGVIINVGAGPPGAMRGEQDPSRWVREQFRAQGMEADVRAAGRGELLPAVEEMAAGGYEAVIAGGGDGTVSSVAEALRGSGILLGILPMGTRNHFAKDLGVPVELEEAVACVGRGEARRVDFGEVNGRMFINNSSIGIYPRTVEERHGRWGRGRLLKLFGTSWAMLKVVRHMPLVRVRLEFEDRTVDRVTPFLFVANNEYAMDLFSLGRRVRLDGGNLSVYTARCTNLGQVAGLVLRGLFNRLEQARNFDIWRVKRFRARLQRSVRVANDGEVARMKPPLEYRVWPRALGVIAPRVESE